ncbi:MAG: AAA family ATPase [Solirubrobacteraceae bacterium]
MRQLFEPLLAAASGEQRQRWLAGAAGFAAPLVDPRAQPVQDAPEASYRLVHALYWLLANLTDDQPVALLVDDLQWADEPSLRLFLFLATRVEALPIAVVIGCRPDCPPIADLTRRPDTRVLRPGPLSRATVARWLRASTGRDLP